MCIYGIDGKVLFRLPYPFGASNAPLVLYSGPEVTHMRCRCAGLLEQARVHLRSGRMPGDRRWQCPDCKLVHTLLWPPREDGTPCQKCGNTTDWNLNIGLVRFRRQCRPCKQRIARAFYDAGLAKARVRRRPSLKGPCWRCGNPEDSGRWIARPKTAAKHIVPRACLECWLNRHFHGPVLVTVEMALEREARDKARSKSSTPDSQ